MKCNFLAQAITRQDDRILVEIQRLLAVLSAISELQNPDINSRTLNEKNICLWAQIQITDDGPPEDESLDELPTPLLSAIDFTSE